MGMWDLISMRSSLAALAIAAIAATAQAQDSDEAAVGKALDELHASASRADAGYFDLFTPDAVFIGTDAEERWSIADFKKTYGAYFAQGKGFTYVPRVRHVTITTEPCRCVAWFDELLDAQKYGTSRSTGVLVKRDGGWKIAQYALTFPIPNDLGDEIIPKIQAYEAAKKK